MSTSALLPRRGDVWRVDFNPTVGAEIQKIRPAVVLSSDGLGRLPLRLVVPITGWKDAFSGNLWHVRIDPDGQNGLSKPSAVDTLQVRGVDLARFVERIGRMKASSVGEVAAALALVTEYQ